MCASNAAVIHRFSFLLLVSGAEVRVSSLAWSTRGSSHPCPPSRPSPRAPSAGLPSSNLCLFPVIEGGSRFVSLSGSILFLFFPPFTLYLNVLQFPQNFNFHKISPSIRFYCRSLSDKETETRVRCCLAEFLRGRGRAGLSAVPRVPTLSTEGPKTGQRRGPAVPALPRPRASLPVCPSLCASVPRGRRHGQAKRPPRAQRQRPRDQAEHTELRSPSQLPTLGLGCHLPLTSISLTEVTKKYI